MTAAVKNGAVPFEVAPGTRLLGEIITWSCSGISIRHSDLVQALRDSGLDEGVARERVLHGSDAANARLVARTRSRADLVVSGVVGDNVPG